jgi:hypothetical protein
MPKKATFIVNGETFEIPKKDLVLRCGTFRSPILLGAPYEVRSPVRTESFRAFITAICGVAPPVTSSNYNDLILLCKEFDFPLFLDVITKALNREGPVDRDARRELQVLKDQTGQQQAQIAELREEVAELKADVASARAALEAALGGRAASKREAREPRSARNRGIKFAPSQSAPLSGIIAYLTEKCGGNVHDQGVVDITASGTWKGHLPKNAADLTADSNFLSSLQEDSWICFDFRDKTVKPTHYTLRSSWQGKRGGNNLKEWVLEGSTDGQNWVRLDRRKNNDLLNDRSAMAIFPVANPEAVNMIRLRQTGQNHGGTDGLVIASLELFGTLIE